LEYTCLTLRFKESLSLIIDLELIIFLTTEDFRELGTVRPARTNPPKWRRQYPFYKSKRKIKLIKFIFDYNRIKVKMFLLDFGWEEVFDEKRTLKTHQGGSNFVNSVDGQI